MNYFLLCSCRTQENIQPEEEIVLLSTSTGSGINGLIFFFNAPNPKGRGETLLITESQGWLEAVQILTQL